MTGEKLQFDWGEMTTLVNAKLGHNGELAVSNMVVKPGKSSPTHYHPNCEEVIYLIRGQLEHRIRDRINPQEPGSTVVVPRGVAHMTTNVGLVDAEVIVAYSSPAPIREAGTP